MNGEIAGLREEISDLRSNMNGEIAGLRADLGGEIASLRREMGRQGERLARIEGAVCGPWRPGEPEAEADR